MRDEGLLADALSDTGAVTTRSDANAFTAEWQGVAAAFTRDQAGIWSAHLTGEVDDARATAIISAIDIAYGRRVQAAVLEKLRERAPDAGLRLESERVEDDDSVVMVLTVQQGA
jgi:hypothetical protein